MAQRRNHVPCSCNLREIDYGCNGSRSLTGFRPIRDDVDYGGTVEGAADPSNPFPEVGTLLTVDEDFGGWDEVSTKFFDEEDGLVTEAILAAGHSIE